MIREGTIQSASKNIRTSRNFFAHIQTVDTLRNLVLLLVVVLVILLAVVLIVVLLRRPNDEKSSSSGITG